MGDRALRGGGARAHGRGRGGAVKHVAHVAHARALLHALRRDQLGLGVGVVEVDVSPAGNTRLGGLCCKVLRVLQGHSRRGR